MNISIIQESLVSPDKRLLSNKVTGDILVDNMAEFCYLANSDHITIATFKDNQKCLDSFIQTSLLAFDFDNGLTSAKDVNKQLSHVNHAILASTNHLKDKGDGKGVIERFHVFIPVSEQITDYCLYKYACEQMVSRYEWKSDNAVMEASRYFFRHKETIFIEDSKSNLSIFGYKQQYKLLKTRKEHLKKRLLKDMNVIGNVTNCFEKTRAYRLLTNGECSVDGNRYSVSNIIIGVAIACGVSLEQTLDYFDKYASYGKHFTRGSIIRRYNSWV